MRVRRPEPESLSEVADQLRSREARLHVLEALVRAGSDPHAVLDVVLQANDRDACQAALRERFGFDEIQANAVMDIQFFRLTPAEQVRLRAIRDDVLEGIAKLKRDLPTS